MKLLGRTLIIIITVTMFFSFISINLTANAANRPAKVGVILYDFKDRNLSLVRNSLENIQKANQDKVNFSFFDSKDNQAIENEIIDNLIRERYDLLVINLVDVKRESVSDVITKVKEADIPVIFFNIELPVDIISTYNKAIVLATDSKLSGAMQGKILVDLWNKNKQLIDKNNDNILQYIMLQGKIDNEAAVNRTIYSISTLNDNGIKTQELALSVCNWQKECAKNAITSMFLRYAGKIEAIIANNDAMAIGAIEALQSYGYNKGDKTKYIPVVGVDAIPEAKELIKQGLMAGTVIQNPDDMANAIYSIGLNLINNKNPFEDTNYVPDKGVIVRTPYYEYNP